ncbi:MAG: N-acetylmuramoyl-L-alanine amidase [Archangium sp.]|nr:N-acetylmuramoyl-L-alanine amidase [Archangium sp.]
MIRAVSAALILAAAAAFGASADDAYQDAKSAYTKLKGDQKRRALRHHWQNVAKKFEAVATRHPKSERAPEALFNSGELNNELSRFSAKDEDREAAKRSYRRLIEGWPAHRLADDAAFSLARLLADREGDPSGARRVLESALKTAGDKKKDMQGMLAALPKEAKPVVIARPAPARQATPARPAPEPLKRAEAPATDVAEAIRRAIRPLQLAQLAEPAPTVQARRAPSMRPDEVEEVEPEVEAPVLEESEPVVASLAEKLRDVRVGARLPGNDDTETRSRFKKLAKEEGGAELTLAQQLGLKVRRVIIDAGHGGHDTGAIGPKGTREKDVALSIAKKLAARLEEAGLEVILTRDDDTFVKLEDRTRFANRQKGDLFISVHCNAAPSKTLRGIETYTLNTSSNRYSIRLAARENSTTERGVGDLQYILADLATKANTGESSHLADRVQRALVRNLSGSYKGVKDLGTKEALFFVLLGAKMPAILVETSFLSHPEEEERLASEEYQQSVADSIAEAVGGFLEERNKVAQVD